MEVVSYRKIYFSFSALLILGSLFGLLSWGLNLGIDFTGGTLMEVEFLGERYSNAEVNEKLSELELGQVLLQSTGDQGLILRLKDINEETHQQILNKLGGEQIEEKRFESIGPAISGELKKKAIWAIAIALLLIVLYIAWAFRKVSGPIASWKYGLAALIALFHDVFITLGVFSLMGYLQGVEIGLPILAAFLTILGYSVNNSIVVFDRIRENLIKTNWTDFSEIINQSINQSLSRCLNTALTTLFVLLAIFFLGGASIKYFALALIIGIIVGTYSSIFITASLVVSWQKRRKS